MVSGIGYRVSGRSGKVTCHSSLFTFFGLGFLLLAFMVSCDIIEAPYTEITDDGSTTGTNPQKVLLFDFTGHTCKSCPKAHQLITQMTSIYGDRLVPVAFHLGYFAKPLLSGKFTTDFRTHEGALLEKYFDFISFPTGTVQNLNRDQLEPYASWSSHAAAHLAGTSPLKIRIVPVYLPGLNAITTEVYVTANDNVAGQLNLAVYLVEDGIVDWQKDEDFDPMDIPDYVHNHVFRTSLNGLWGQPLGMADGVVKGFSFETEFSKVLTTGWNAQNCKLVVFVYQEDTKEIIQVESRGIVQ